MRPVLLMTLVLLLSLSLQMVNVSFWIPISDQFQLPPFHPEFFLGTDPIGRSVLRKAIVAIVNTVLFTLSATLLAVLLAQAYSLWIVSAKPGGRMEGVLVTGLDLLSSIPSLLWLLMLRMHLPLDLPLWVDKVIFVLTLAFASFMGIARVLVKVNRKLAQSQFTEAARAQGASSCRILTRTWGPFLLDSCEDLIRARLPGMMMREVALSALGFGLSVQVITIGSFLKEGLDQLSAQGFQALVIPVLLSVGVTLFVGSLFRR